MTGGICYDDALTNRFEVHLVLCRFRYTLLPASQAKPIQHVPDTGVDVCMDSGRRLMLMLRTYTRVCTASQCMSYLAAKTRVFARTKTNTRVGSALHT